MSTNEIVNRARVLDEAYEIDAVISLLKDYVRENPNDRDAMAFYLKNQASKITLEYDEASQLYSIDTNRYSGLSTEKALMVSEWCLAYIISCAYLKNGPENDQEAEVCGALKTELLSLGSHAVPVLRSGAAPLPSKGLTAQASDRNNYETNIGYKPYIRIKKKPHLRLFLYPKYSCICTSVRPKYACISALTWSLRLPSAK